MYALLIESDEHLAFLEGVLSERRANAAADGDTESVVKCSGLILQVALARSHRGGAAVIPF